MTEDRRLTTRFAPSPTGYLHLGHLASALAGWRRARAAGGRFLLRLEDIDAGRCRAEYAAGVMEDLAWAGLDWDGAVRVQSAHFNEYRLALARLEAMGLLYPCFCTRAEVVLAMGAPHGVEAVYPGTCRGLAATARGERMAAGRGFAWRLDVAAAVRMVGAGRYLEENVGWVVADPKRLGDVVLARKDVPASYHICVVHDDGAQGVTHVTRGEDLARVTDVQVLLQRLLGWPTPVYAHHALLTDASGRRLAKRDQAMTLRAMRAAGVTQAALWAAAGVEA